MPTQTRRLPLYVALAALVLYAGTMGGGLTLNGLPLASKLAGWADIPMVGQPLLWLLTLPLRGLPAAWVPLMLKLLAAALAAAILGLLTRTVQMLPWERPWDNASRLACALPGLTACAVCGLDFSFWQEATSTCGDLLDLLLLAGGLWLLLEYKNDRQNSRWLTGAIVVWGLGMAENWVMLLALPLFVIAVIWVERFRFIHYFRWKYILQLAAPGLAGFLVYAVLPMANGLLPDSPWSLGQAWVVSLHQTKSVLLLPHRIWRAEPFVALAVAICFLVPTLPLLVRMRDEDARDKSDAGRFQQWLYRGLRLSLLLACCWLAFDPSPGARQVMHKMGIRLPLLTFDYLNALGTAYLVGSLLLTTRCVVRDGYRLSRNRNPWRRLPLSIATAGLVVIVAGLAVRNAPALWWMNHHPLEQFGDEAVNSLPAGKGVMLSDDPDKLMVFQAALSRRHGTADWVAVETHALRTVQYRARLEQRLPAGWLTDQTRHELTLVETLQLLEQVARTNRLLYLHPSQGLFFEKFYLEPTGTIYEMKRRRKDPLDVPPMPGAALAANEQFWTRLWDQELARAVPSPPRASGWANQLARCGLTPPPRDQDRLLGEWYSLPLEAWGVTLQKQGRLRAAQARFEQALQLNSNNLPARISLACNTNLQAGQQLELSNVSQRADQLGGPPGLNLIMALEGPFDEPTACYLAGSVYFEHGMFVQAAEQLERVRTLAPGSLGPELALAGIYNRLQLPDRSRPLVNHLREQVQKEPANNLLDLDLAVLESQLWLMQTNPANTRDPLQSVLQQHRNDPEFANRVLYSYLALGEFTNALELAEERLAKSPDDVRSLNAKAFILKQSGQAAEALPILDHILALTNEPSVRLARAFARIDTKDFASARSDLEELGKSGQASEMVDFGLALVAEHGHDTNSARHYLQLCLSNTPAGTPLWRQAHVRLQLLEPANK
ncbi:MAG: DUF2723 domain-containing protein [Verrucomicrobiota bacterium]|jgi:tetratricopeptide (TPR) repeat protein